MDVAVVVPTWRRPLRLRWLLEALAEQTVPFEPVIVHAADDEETAAVLRYHRLEPRVVVTPPGTGPAVKRNAGWRATDASLVVFTDDDCRPPADWLAGLVAAAAAAPGAIIQGATRVDPDELGIFLTAPHARSQEIEPPNVMAQTCNIAYPRALLKRAGGFDESFVAVMGEDTDLYLRSGGALVPARAAVTYHAVDWGLRKRVRGAGRWQHMAGLVRKHPVLRESLPLRGYALDASHAWWLLAAAGLAVPAARGAVRRAAGLPRPDGAEAPLRRAGAPSAAARLAHAAPLRRADAGRATARLAHAAPLRRATAGRAAARLALAAPWILAAPRRYGTGPRGLARTAAELPGEFVAEGALTLAMLRGSLRYRTLVL